MFGSHEPEVLIRIEFGPVIVDAQRILCGLGGKVFLWHGILWLDDRVRTGYSFVEDWGEVSLLVGVLLVYGRELVVAEASPRSTDH